MIDKLKICCSSFSGLNSKLRELTKFRAHIKTNNCGLVLTYETRVINDKKPSNNGGYKYIYKNKYDRKPRSTLLSL